MAERVGRGVVDIEPDVDGFGKKLDRDIERDGGKFGAIGKKAGGFLALGFVGAAAGAAAAIPGLVSAASDQQEALSKVAVVFGDNAKAVEDWASTSAMAFGQSKSQALEAAGTYGNLFQAFGLGRGEAQEMSTSLTELAADLASFNNTSIDEALQALQSGVSGETEPLKRYGIAINDVRLREEALALGLIKTTKDALSPAAKAQASYALIMKDTTLAQGDFARTSDGLANKQRIMSARFADLKATIGAGLIPIASKFFGIVLELTGGITAFIAAFKAGDGDITSSGLPGFLERLGFFTRQVVDAFKENGLGGAISFLGQRLAQAWPTIQAALGDLLGKLLQQLGLWAEAFVAWIKPLIPPFLAELGALVAAGAAWLLDVGLPTLIAKLKKWGDEFVAWIGPAIPPMLVELTKLLLVIGEWIVTTGAPKLLVMALDLAWALTGWAFTLGIQLVKGIGQSLLEVAKKVPGWVLDAAKWGKDMALGLIGDFVVWYVTLPIELGKKTAEIARKLGGIGKDIGLGLANGVIEAWNKLDLKIDVGWKMPGWLGGAEFKIKVDDIIPDIPKIAAANGAVITEPTIALMGEVPRARPEIVTPERLLRQIMREEGFANAPAGGAFAGASFEFHNVENPRDVADELYWLTATGGRS
jgi:hypothetical protein